jgi:hypothetical protein
LATKDKVIIKFGSKDKIMMEVWYTQISGNCKINAQVLSFHVWHFKEAEHLK